jgi:zinc/manganese transport system substrate-binding protein
MWQQWVAWPPKTWASVLAVAATAIVAPRICAAGAPLVVVAAENFYGDVARQIGGERVRVTSILNNPDQDPHLFELSPSVARTVSDARVVVYNGIGYDPWIEKLLGAASRGDRSTIDVGTLVGRKAGDNPHVWYDPATMPAVAQALADDLGVADPAHRADYQQRLGQFSQSLQPISQQVAALRRRLSGTPVTATEPVFGEMLAALGLPVRNEPFQLAVMNNTEPSAADVAAFEDDLRGHRVRLLVYNSQASDPVARRMVQIATTARIPVVAVTETEPPGTSYQEWILSELEALDRALPK